MSKAKNSKKAVTLQHGFSSGNWERTFQAIADARNSFRDMAKEACPDGCLVEHYEFAFHGFTTRGTVASKPILVVGLTRTKGSIQRAAAEFHKKNPDRPFAVIYRGWYDGTKCLPRYNAPCFPTDRMERLVSFEVPVFYHSGVTDGTGVSHEEQAMQAMQAALGTLE